MSISNSEKYIELAIKYKTHTMILLSFLMLTAVFFIGRYTINIPSKETVCKSEITTIKNLFTELEKCQSSCVDMLRQQRDKDEKECLQRIQKAIKDSKGTIEILSCSEAKAIMPQCKKRGQWK
jgi:hypothetical protein